MHSLDYDVLQRLRGWQEAGHHAHLVTVVRTFGSAPRPVGALAAVRDDGVLAGSVSGGCVESDLSERAREGDLPGTPQVLDYGVDAGTAARFGLPCGGRLQLLVEPVGHAAWLRELLARAGTTQPLRRTLDLASGTSLLDEPQGPEGLSFDGRVLRQVFGPRWRLFVIGAGQLSEALIPIAQLLDYAVTVCDPREEVTHAARLADAALTREMPDDAALTFAPDAHSAIVALSHDPKLDDLGLLEALRSQAFFIGALGSRRASLARRERLALFDLNPAQIARLSAPIGLAIGSHSPAEIAVSVMAEITAVRNRVPVLQKMSGEAEAAVSLGR